MRLLYRAEQWLTPARLVPAWANELADASSSSSQIEGDLWHYLYEDIINARLDDSGPLWNGSRLGLRVIDVDSGQTRYVEGRLLFGTMGLPFRLMGGRILVAKEAVLDFARRHQLPPPSWSASEGESQPSRSPGQLKPSASTTMINEVIKSEYDAAEAAGRKPPNIKELAAAVQLLLEQKGFSASKRRIQLLGEAEKFKRRRRPPGKTLKSERQK
jgi:hypothetical protein